MSFYRTYRPQIIDELDNLQVKEQLLALVKKDRNKLPHAYLFVGPRGSGKTTAARLVAKIVNCKKLTTAGPCGTCDQCVSIAKNTNLDVIEIDAASNRGIDEIRQLRDRIGFAPSQAAYTVYIIDEVHMLTTEAFNALLKTLEEPPHHVIFVLATTEMGKIPATIQSRCIVVPFNKAKVPDVVKALTRIINAENITIDSEAVTSIAQKTDGSFRDAVKMLEQASLSGKDITVLSIENLFSSVSTVDLTKFIASILAKDQEKAFSLIEMWSNTQLDFKQCMSDCIVLLEKELIQIVKGVQSPWKETEIVDLITMLVKNSELIRLSPIPQLPLELTIIEFCQKNLLPTEKNQQTNELNNTMVDVPKITANNSNESLFSTDRLSDHWKDFIATIGKTNHSVAGVLRSTRPKAVEGDIVTIEAFYSFHKDKLSESAAKEVMASAIKTLFGEKVSIQIELGKK